MTTGREQHKPTERNVGNLKLTHVRMGLHYNVTGSTDNGKLDLKLSVVIGKNKPAVKHVVRMIGTYTDDNSHTVTELDEIINLKPAQEQDLENRIVAAMTDWYVQYTHKNQIKSALRTIPTS